MAVHHETKHFKMLLLNLFLNMDFIVEWNAFIYHPDINGLGHRCEKKYLYLQYKFSNGL